jgi:hypothetical protein
MPGLPPVINGSKAVHIQPAKYGRTESGEYCELEWVGPNAALQTLIPFCRLYSGLFHVEESSSGGASRLTARFATAMAPNFTTPEAPEDNWQYFANVVQKDVLEAHLPNVNPAFTDAEINSIRTNLDHLDAIDFDENTRDEVLEVFNLMRSGVTSVRVLEPMLRHTQTVSQLWKVKASTQGVGRIFTTEILLDAEDIPEDLLIDLPNFSSNKPGLAYGWYKHFPSIRTSALQKVQIEQEWEYGLWATLLYEFV